MSRMKSMNKPAMILFDYGHTLLYELGFDALRCEEAAFPYIIKNSQNLTAEQIYGEVQRLFQRFGEERDREIEIHDWREMVEILKRR